jgi:hypothetical protein
MKTLSAGWGTFCPGLRQETDSKIAQIEVLARTPYYIWTFPEYGLQQNEGSGQKGTHLQDGACEGVGKHLQHLFVVTTTAISTRQSQ